jgi:putative ABC transport system permease protein
MVKNSLKVFFRNIQKNKIITLINITGLVLGITSTIFIIEYVFYERSFDSFHKNADNIYRVVYNRYRDETLLWKTANSFYPTGSYLKNHFQEVRNYFNLIRNYNIEVSGTGVTSNKTSYFEEKTYYASTSIFDILTLPLVKGNGSCLSAPNTVALSEKAVKKYFGNEDPIGKTIKVNNNDSYTVTGVYEDIPRNSHIRTDLLFSFSTVISRAPHLMNNWQYDYGYTYIQLAEGTDYKNFGEKALDLMIKDNYQDLLEPNDERDEYFLQPLRSIHLQSAIEYETEPPGNGRGVSILFGFSIFFLIIAWINYVNLVTAQSVERAKEIGIKKITGASKKRLIFQFVSEAFIFNLFCLFISILFILQLNPLFKQLTGIETPGFVFDLKFCLTALTVFFAGALLSSICPAFLLTSFQPVKIIKGKYTSSGEGLILRKILVSFQLFISISLLIGTAIIYRQVNYLIKKDMGYKCNSTIVLKAPRTNEDQSVYQKKILLFREKLKKYPEVTGSTFISDAPFKEINNWFSCYRKGFDRNTENAYFRTDIDEEFIPVFRIRLLAGRGFSLEDKNDPTKLIINLKALKRLGFSTPDDAVGQFVMNGPENEYQIIGVIDDFNYYSSKVEPIPTIFTARDDSKIYVAIKHGVDDSVLQPLINKIKPEYNTLFPGSAFEYSLLDESMKNDIRSDHTFALVFGVFSLLAIIIGVIGMLGLTIIIINHKLKQLGIRKVLGADMKNLFGLLSGQSVWEFVIAVIIAIPFTAYVYEKWVLNSYIYHISLNWTYFFFPVIFLLLLLTIITISMTFWISRINPVETLRYE